MDREKLYNDNLKLVQFTVCRYRLHEICKHITIDYEDIIQLGNIGLYKATRVYDPAKGSFSTIAVAHIRGSIMKEYRDRTNYRRKEGRREIDFGVTHLDAHLSGKDDSCMSIAERIGEDDQALGLIELREDLNSMLNERELFIVDLRIKGLNQTEIARRVGVTQVQVSRILSKVKLKLSGYMQGVA